MAAGDVRFHGFLLLLTIGAFACTLAYPSRRDTAGSVQKRFFNGDADLVPDDPGVKRKRDKVREMMAHSWEGYARHAWGWNEVSPVSHLPHGGTFGSGQLGASIVDGLDTLYIMGLEEQYNTSRDWIANNFRFDVDHDVSVFESNIRFVGGFLSAFALTGDKMYIDKAKEVADKLLPAFNTPTGIPLAQINPTTGQAHNYGWVSSRDSILAELGTLHLEFDLLSRLTGDYTYRKKVMAVRTFLKKKDKPDGLYPIFIDESTGEWGSTKVTLGALGDSFYEYLLKEWLISNKQDTEAREMYDEAMKGVYDKMVQTSPGGLVYIGDYSGIEVGQSMGHLACFAAGMIGLGAEGSEDKDKYIQLGEDIANTCHESYIRSATGLGPEVFSFSDQNEAMATGIDAKYYILRPEVAEGWFYMWRLTKKQKYRDWAWEMVQALEKHCRAEAGFSGLQDVYMENPIKDDVQQSFFLAETLKYLYLIFSDDSLLPFDKWVFNTEAHPLPVV